MYVFHWVGERFARISSTWAATLPGCWEAWPTMLAVPEISNVSAATSMARENVGAVTPYCRG